jgi:hypothetical protein
LATIESLDEIPQFGSEAEEAEYWDTHEFSDELWDSLPEPPPDWLPPVRPKTKPVAIRFDESTLDRLKVLATKKHKGYQTLLKEFVMERLYEEEKREGLIA